MSGKKYLVRMMQNGNEMRRWETNDREEAGRIYRDLPCSRGGGARSLRINGRKLVYDDELYLMGMGPDKRKGGKIRYVKEDKPPKAKQEKKAAGRQYPAYVCVNRTKRGDCHVYVSSGARQMLGDAEFIIFDVDRENREITITRSDFGAAFEGSGYLRARAALKGVDIPEGVRLPVERCANGIKFCY